MCKFKKIALALALLQAVCTVSPAFAVTEQCGPVFTYFDRNVGSDSNSGRFFNRAKKTAAAAASISNGPIYEVISGRVTFWGCVILPTPEPPAG